MSTKKVTGKGIVLHKALADLMTHLTGCPSDST